MTERRDNWPTQPWNMVLGIGKVQLVDDTGSVQTGQVQLSAAETRDQTPMPKHFGFDSNAPAGSDVVYAALHGQRTKVVVLGTNHQPSRLRGLPSGGSRQYDQGGRQVLLDNSGLIKLMAPGEVLHQLVTQVFQDLFNAHTHGKVMLGGGFTGPPIQQMTAAHLTTATRAGT